MHTLISTFILEAYLRRQFEGRFSAASLSLDVAGFTALTEALARHGQSGSEALADVMSTLFEPLVQSVHAQAGFLTHFAGDGFTALFPGPETRANRRALAAGWAIRQHLRTHPECATPFGAFPLSARVGIARGEVTWGILPAGEGLPLAWYFSGPAMVDCIRAQQQAGRGEVIVSDTLAASAQKWLTAAEGGSPAPAVRVTRLTPDREPVHEAAQSAPAPAPADEVPVPWPPLPRDRAALEEAAAHFLPPAVRELADGGELRNAVAVFLAARDVHDRETLAAFMAVVFDLQRRYGGYLSNIDLGSDECRVLLFWGAPVAHESDVEQALNFALDAQARGGRPLRAGITYRVTYAGRVGAARRADYVCYGQGTNLAARLVAAAGWGDIWLDEAIARRVAAPSRTAATHFTVEPLGERMFKGFAAPQPIFALCGRRIAMTSLRFSGPLVGRQRELEQITAAMEPLLAGRPAGIIAISGEAGIGKSRLVHELRQRLGAAASSGQPAISWFDCPADEIRRYSLEPFRHLLRAYCEQAAAGNTQADAENARRFSEKLDTLTAATHDPGLRADLERGLPFLAALADLHWPDPRYDEAEPKARFDNTLSALQAFLLAESRSRPLVLALEDAHWLDADSIQFLQRLTQAQHDAPLCILLVSREPLALAGYDAALPRHELRLAPLTAAELSELAGAHLGAPAAPALLDLLQARTEGNPFFAGQLLRHLQEQGSLAPNAAGALAVTGHASLPADVRGVLIARVDRLAPPVRDVVQRAAVLGRAFETTVLAEFAPDGPALDTRVAAAADAGIWAPLDAIHYQFQHALLREAVYDMQLRARLRQLHGAAAVALEHIHAASLAPYYGDLVYHYGQAGEAAQERHYARLAGERAAAQFANTEAVTYLSRALALTPEDAEAERFSLLYTRLLVYDLQGARDAQKADLTALTTLAERLDDAGRAAVAVQAARYAYMTGDYRAAVREAGRAAEMVPAGSETATRVHLVWGQALSWMGEYAGARTQLAEALAGAKSNHLAMVETHCWFNLGMVSYSQTDFTRARAEIIEAQRVSRACGDRRIEGMAMGMLGSITYDQGNYGDAKTWYQQALSLCREIGDRPNAGISLGNLGNIALYQGDYAAAQAYASEGLPICREVGNRYGEAVMLHLLGQIARNLGDYPAAAAYYERSLQLAREIEGQGEAADALASLGLLSHQIGENREAERLSREALATVEPLGEQHIRANALTALGHALAASGDLAGAAAAHRDALAGRRAAGEKTRALDNLAGLAEIALAEGDLAQARQHVEEILAHLAAAPADGAEEPLRIYLACCRVLHASGDLRGADILETARGLLAERAAKITDLALRRSYLENVPVHRVLAQIADR